MIKNINKLIALFILFCCPFWSQKAVAQQIASPANWLYLGGNPEATRSQTYPTLRQTIHRDSIIIKWATSEINGDVVPLVGNVVNNPKLSSAYPWAPNEIVAAIGGELVIVGANGSVIAKQILPPNIRRISVLFDSTALQAQADIGFPVVMGVETIEADAGRDSMAFCYIYGYSQDSSNSILIKRLTIDLRDYAPNNSASISPFFGRSNNGELTVFARVNMSQPLISPTYDPLINPAPYFRGVSQFNTADYRFPFPRPDIRDTVPRHHLAQNISFGIPSLSKTTTASVAVLFPSTTINPIKITQPVTSAVRNIAGGNTLDSDFDNIFLHYLELGGSNLQLGKNEVVAELFLKVGNRPQVKPYYVKLIDAGKATQTEEEYVLLAEEYSGQNSSIGTPTLHLYQYEPAFSRFRALTFPIENTPGQLELQSFSGGNNHLWSIAVGDVDGVIPPVQPLPYFQINPGNEIVATQTTPQLASPTNRLYVLRYRTGNRIEKPTSRRDSLNYLDTIATSKISGYVAAVSDFDGLIDGKAEIFIVDNNTFRIMRMRNYDDPRFLQGKPFDTLYSYTFPAEPIRHLAVVDAEGDGYNDILVTTTDRTYLFGRLVISSQAFTILDPKTPQTPNRRYCFGDTVNIVWQNVIGKFPSLNVYFQPYTTSTAANAVGARRTVQLGISNTTNIVTFPVIADVARFGTSGRFIVENPAIPAQKDSTAILDFVTPFISMTAPTNGTRYIVGDNVTISGSSACMSSVGVQIRIGNSPSATWQTLTTLIPNSLDGSFSTVYTIPCFPNFASCSGRDQDSIVRFRAIGLRNNALTSFAGDTTIERRIIVRPDTLQITVVTSGNVNCCPDRTFGITSLPVIPECDTILVSISTDRGRTFSVADTIVRADPVYFWKVSTTIPDTVVFRFCCQNSCARGDVMIPGARPKFVNIVSPNPFDPENLLSGAAKPGVNVTYAVPRTTTVSMKIFDASNRLVALPLNAAEREANIVYCDNWDGIIEGKRTYAANGTYYLVMEFGTGETEIYTIFVAKGY